MSRPQRRTWENGTFIKAEVDLVNQPDVVPHAPSDQVQFFSQFLNLSYSGLEK